MSTRYLTMVIIDNTCKVAQYGHFDGYLSGAGLDIVNYIRNEQDIASFISNVRKCEFTQDRIPENESWEVLKDIEKAPQLLHDHSRFADDSLFCEWAYVLDMDNDTLEIYKGFNKKPLDASERFYR